MDDMIKALRKADIYHTTDPTNITNVDLGSGRRIAISEATEEDGSEANGYDATWYDTDEGVEREIGSEWFDHADKAVEAIQSRMS